MVVVALVMFYIVAFRLVRLENKRLLEDVEDLFRPWRTLGVSANLKKVSYLRIVEDRTNTRNGLKKQPTRTINCYCLEIAIVQDTSALAGGRQASHEDERSVGTCNTNDSDE